MNYSLNYTKILSSAMLIAFVVALAFAGTQAFFNDEETSAGNLFTAGALDLLVDSQSHYAGLVCNDQGVWEIEDVDAGTTRPDLEGEPCDGTWEMTDLGPENTFFNFDDLKPGDEGENTISLHVENNDAYACVIIDNIQDDDNGTTEPEAEAGDVTPGDGDGLGGGELSQELRFFAWADNDIVDPGNNIWDAGEPVLFSNVEGPASDVIDGVVYPLFTPDTGPLNGAETTYIGLYWCYGDIEVDQISNTLTCDGAGGTNLTQTDSLSADITFYVEQARNNEEFTCPALPLPEAAVSQGETWSPVDSAGKLWFAKARNNNANFELAVGTNDAGPEQDTAEATWVAETVYGFTLAYDGAGTATFTVDGQSPVTYAVGTDTYSRIGINAKAQNGGITMVDNLSLNTVAPLPTDMVTANGAGSNDVESLTIESDTLDGAWELTGTFEFSSLIGGSQEYPAVQFSID